MKVCLGDRSPEPEPGTIAVLPMRILEGLLVRRHWVLALWIALAAVATPGLLRLASDNSAEVFFVRDAEQMERYHRFQVDFGRDRSVRLVISGSALATREGLAWLGRLEEKAALLPGVFGTAGLSIHHRHRPEGWPPADPSAFWDDVRSDPLDVEAGFALGGDSRSSPTATVLVALYNLPVDRERETLRQIAELLAGAPSELETTMIGLPVLQRAMDEEMVAFGTRLVPLLGLVALALLGVALRRPGAVLLPWIPTVICLVIVLGFRGWAGSPINMVEVLLVPLLVVIALATAVHVQMRFRDLSRESPETRSSEARPSEAVLATYREKGWPVLWTGLTTLVGFGSLTVSSVPPVRSLGIWAAGGLALITAAMLTLFPALLATAGRRLAVGSSRGGGASYDRWAAGRGRAWATWATRPASRRLLVAGFGGLALFALAGLPLLVQDTDLIGYFPPDHPVREEMIALEARGLSTGAAELVLTVEGSSASDPPFESPEGLESLARISSALREVPGVLGVVSAGELWRSTRAEEPPESPFATSARLLTTPELLGLLRVLRTDDGRQARISVSLPMQGFEDLEPTLTRLQEAAERAVREELPDLPVRVERTGRYPMVLAAQQRVLATMIASLSLTLGIVAAIFLLLLRSLRLTLVALVPNLWPVLCVLGAMGWLGVPLDGTTVMIAAVVMGLAVDDTLHTLGRFRREEGEAARAAIATLEHTAPAHLLTTAMLAAGFGVCGLAGFVPIARFGALTALALALALVADLLLLPALLAGSGARSTAHGSAHRAEE